MGSTMRAIVQDTYGSFDALNLERIAVPSPAPDEVLLRVHAAGIDRGTWHVLTGEPRIARLGLGLRHPKQRVPGLDASGTVLAVGSRVTRFAAGDEVFGIARGALAELAVAKESKLSHAPVSCSVVATATLGVSGLTAIQALDAARVERGSRVLVTGASGGVGTFAVQVAVGRGAHVTAVCSAAKAPVVRNWGADRVIDYAVQDPTRLEERFDAVIDIAGCAPASRMRRVLAPRGTIVFVGQETGGRWTGGYGRPARDAARFLLRRQRFVMLVSREVHVDLERLAALVDDGTVNPRVHATFPLDAAPDAIRELTSGRVVGKVAVVIDPAWTAEVGTTQPS